MKIREALINQSPSLALQRQAADTIAELDAQLEYHFQENVKQQKYILKLENKVKDQADRISDYGWKESPGQGCY